MMQPGGRKRAGRSDILFVGEAVSLAHVGRPALLARWAGEAGYEVHFACGNAERFHEFVRGEGLHPRPLKSIRPQTFYGRLAKGRFFYTRQELREYIHAERALMGITRPDLVVSDFRLSMPISAANEGVPLLTLGNAYWSPEYTPSWIPPGRGFWGCMPLALRSLAFDALRPLAFRYFAANLDRVRKEYGLAPLGDFRRHYTHADSALEQECAYLDHPDFVSTAPMPRGRFYLGPLPWRPREIELSPVGFSDKRPLAYVTMGGQGDLRILKKVIRVIKTLGFNMVVSGMPSEDLTDLRANQSALQGRLAGGPLVDPTCLIPKPDLTICHGGSGTVYQSLEAGIPVLCLPGNPDQDQVAHAVRKKGVGLSVVRCRAGESDLTRAIQAIIDSTVFRRCALKFSRLLRAWDTKAHWLNFLKKRLGPSQSRGLNRTTPEQLSRVPASDHRHTAGLPKLFPLHRGGSHDHTTH